MGSVTNPKKPTLESLADQMRRLQERIEDMEDLIELRSAIERNGGKSSVPWEQAKAELDID
jgi:TolA-binding protein